MNFHFNFRAALAASLAMAGAAFANATQGIAKGFKTHAPSTTGQIGSAGGYCKKTTRGSFAKTKRQAAKRRGVAMHKARCRG